MVHLHEDGEADAGIIEKKTAEKDLMIYLLKTHAFLSQNTSARLKFL